MDRLRSVVEAQRHGQTEGHQKYGVDAEVKGIWAWIVSSWRQEVAGPPIQAQVFVFLLFGGAADVRDVPHSNRGEERNGTVDDPVGGDETGFGPIPEIEGETDGNTWEDGVGEGCEPDFASSDRHLNLRAVDPARYVDQVMRDDDGELKKDETGKGSDQVSSDSDVAAIRGAVLRRA